MQQGKHTGKIVVSMDKETQKPKVAPGFWDPLCISPDATYWLVGGVGGFGLAVAKWLVRHGARSLVLSGRSATVSAEIETELDWMRGQGASVHYWPADASNLESLTRTVGRIRASLPPLRGVFHMAMVLEDKLLVDLDRDTWDRVLKPKVHGGWNLHEATRDLTLDHFVLFSSLSSVFGHAGQANYSAANAFLDSLAHYRRSQGLPGLVINWGHLGETGYLSQRKAWENGWSDKECLASQSSKR